MATVSEKVEKPAILAKVKPAPWKDAPLVENRRSFHWVTEKDLRDRRIQNTHLVVVVLYYSPVYCQFYGDGFDLSSLHRCW